MEEKKNKIAVAVVWVLAITSSILFYYFVVYTGVKLFFSEEDFVLASEGQFGDFIGGVVGTIIAALGFILLYLTLTEQRKALIEQRKAFKKERFESKFFELMKLHRENVSEMTIKLEKKKTIYVNDIPQKKSEIITYEGREVMRFITEQITSCRKEISAFFRNIELTQIYNTNYLLELQNEKSIVERKINLKELAKIDITNCIIYFGVEYNGSYVLQQLFANKYNVNFCERIINFISLKPHSDTDNYISWRKIRKVKSLDTKIRIVDAIFARRKNLRERTDINFSPSNINLNEVFYKNDFEKYYCGVQLQLGHYFRHLYQTINYVNNQNNLPYYKKYAYVKTLRAQLSTYEQIVFFFNSLSSLGNIWELRCTKKFMVDEIINENRIINNQLVTKYNLIKNLPSGQLLRQDFAKFYPDVEFEFDQTSNNRSELIKKYN